MFNVGGGELLVIFFMALVVLGPTKLPEVARQMGGMMRELRKISSGFQAEMKAAMDDPIEAASRERGKKVVSSDQRPMPTPRFSTAETAGMYDLQKAGPAARDDEELDDVDDGSDGLDDPDDFDDDDFDDDDFDDLDDDAEDDDLDDEGDRR